MSDQIRCRRCGEEKAPLSAAPLPGPTGEQIRSAVCPDCWREWEAAEVMVINELRLNFMDPEAPKVLEQHMREFLFLETNDA